MEKPKKPTAQPQITSQPITEIGVFASGPLARQLNELITSIRELIGFLQDIKILKQFPKLPVRTLQSPPDKIDMGIGVKIPNQESWNRLQASISVDRLMKIIGFAILGVLLAGGVCGYGVRWSCESRPSAKASVFPSCH